VLTNGKLFIYNFILKKNIMITTWVENIFPKRGRVLPSFMLKKHSKKPSDFPKEFYPVQGISHNPVIVW